MPLILVVLAILSAYGLNWLLEVTRLQDKLWWLEIPSVLGFYGFYWWLFDRWIWRWSLLRTIGLIQVPNLNGHWAGYGVSSFLDEKGARTKFNIKDVEIRQRWTRLSVWLREDASRSRSLVAAVMVDDGQHPTLSYEYRNEPGSHAAAGMHIHPGMQRLELVNDVQLEGEYYTGRGRQNYGSLYLTKKK